MIKLKNTKGRSNESLYEEWNKYLNKYLLTKNGGLTKDKSYFGLYKIKDVFIDKQIEKKLKIGVEIIKHKHFSSGYEKNFVVNNLLFAQYDFYILDKSEMDKIIILWGLESKND